MLSPPTLCANFIIPTTPSHQRTDCPPTRQTQPTGKIRHQTTSELFVFSSQIAIGMDFLAHNKGPLEIVSSKSAHRCRTDRFQLFTQSGHGQVLSVAQTPNSIDFGTSFFSCYSANVMALHHRFHLIENRLPGHFPAKSTATKKKHSALQRSQQATQGNSQPKSLKCL